MIRSNFLLLSALLTSITLTTACSHTQGPSDAQLRPAVQAAVDSNSRPAADLELDAVRKPAEVLTFFQLQPGMKIIDVFGGGGYYTEITSHLVGSNGEVTLYNNTPWDNFVNKQVADRLANDRLPNVSALMVSPEELRNVTQRYDAAIFILGMHDLYYEDLANGWPAIDVREFLRNIHQLLNEDGILGIIDHNAQKGTDPAVVGLSLHRVDPGRMIRDLESAGFKLEDRSDILRNPQDDLTGLVFSKEMRWKSDRSVLRFRKR